MKNLESLMAVTHTHTHTHTHTQNSLKTKNGITLIALIITIIVMLILVGVTINFAINGGIVTKSKEAANAMQKAADREELQMAVISAMNYSTGLVDRTELVSSLSSNWQVTNSAPYTCTSPSGNVFTVTENGLITEEGESSGGGETPEPTPEQDEEDTEDLDYLKTYFMGAIDNETGERPKNINFTSLTTENGFTDEEITLAGNDWQASSILEGNTYYIYISYQNVEYKLETGTLTGYTTDVTSLSYNKNGLVGRTATVDGAQYIVLYDAGEKDEYVQLVSLNTLGVDSISLDADSNLVDWTDSTVITQANIFNDTDVNDESVLTSLEKYIYMYNNAIDILNDECESLIGNSNSDIKDVRCVGTNPTNKNSQNTTLYTSELLGELPDSSNNYTPGYCDEKLYAGDTNYISDVDRMMLLQVLMPLNEKDYWFGSRKISESDTNIYFGVRCIDNEYYTYASNIRVRSDNIGLVGYGEMRTTPSNLY